MKTNRIIILIALIIAAAAAYAQKRLTIHCDETGDTSLDSIPYLMEHARNKESWAYEALAECYRYGKGVEKCITNAIIYYDESDLRARDVAEEAYANDPTDELGFMNHIMKGLGKEKITIADALTLIDEYPDPKPAWMKRMKTILDNRNVEDLEGYIRSSIDWNTITGDEMLASVGCLMILRPDTPSIISNPPTPEFMRLLTIAADKIPMLYKIVGDKYIDIYNDCPTDEKVLKNAFELYHNAYLYGLLDMRGAVTVLDYRDNNTLYEGFPFSQEELAHLDGFYSKEYRDQLREPCTVEEVVVEEVELDENPVGQTEE